MKRTKFYNLIGMPTSVLERKTKWDERNWALFGVLKNESPDRVGKVIPRGKEIRAKKSHVKMLSVQEFVNKTLLNK